MGAGSATQQVGAGSATQQVGVRSATPQVSTRGTTQQVPERGATQQRFERSGMTIPMPINKEVPTMVQVAPGVTKIISATRSASRTPMQLSVPTSQASPFAIPQIPALQLVQDNYEFQVTSVNLDPIKYIILSDEQRVFLGGILPGGYKLIDFDLDALNLEKNGRITTYILKIN